MPSSRSTHPAGSTRPTGTAGSPPRATSPRTGPSPGASTPRPAEQLEIDEVVRELRVPKPLNPIGIGWAGPTLLVAGTEEQQQRWLPGILDGSELWCQLFSEPGAGSDLAAARPAPCATATSTSSTARRCGRRSRTWRSSGILLARTDSIAERTPGITYFVVDMRDARHRGEAARADDRHARVQRGVLHRRARPGREHRRRRARRVAAREGDARQRTGVALGRRRAVGTRPDRERRRRNSSATTAVRATRSSGNDSRSSTSKPKCCGSSGCAPFRRACAGSSPGPKRRCARRWPTSTAST